MVTHCRAAPEVACGEGEVGEARNAPRFLEQQRGGPRGHWSRRIDEEFPRWHRSPRLGQLENVVVLLGLNGEGVTQGHGGGHPPRSGSSAGRLVRCGGWSVRARVGCYGGEENNVYTRLKRVQNQITRGVRCGRRHAEAGGARGLASGSYTGAAETDAGRVVSGAVREGEWTARVGRPGRKRWVEPRETVWFWIYLN
jgi:hypothetical protein